MDGAVTKRLTLIAGYQGKGLERGIRNVRAGFQRLHGVALRVGRVIGRALTTPLGMLGMAGGIYGLIRAFTGLLGASTAQEEIFRKLQTAVESTGITYQSVKKEIDTFLASMQKTTRYGDTDLAPVLQMIIQMTGKMEGAFLGARIAAGMAAAKLFDVNTAAKYVAMAMAGEVTMLGRYIPELKTTYGLITQNMTATEKWAIAKELLSKYIKFAEKDLYTFSGMMQSLRNYIGDVKERIGDLIAQRLTPKLTEWRDAIIDFIETGRLEEWARDAEIEVKKLFDSIEKRTTWIWERREYLASGFKILAGMGIVVLLGSIITKLWAMTEALYAVGTAAVVAFGASGLGIVAIAAGGIVGGWILIADAAGTCATAAEEAAEAHKKAMEVMAESSIITWEKVDGKWVKHVQIVKDYLAEVNRVAEIKMGGAIELPGITVTAGKVPLPSAGVSAPEILAPKQAELEYRTHINEEIEGIELLHQENMNQIISEGSAGWQEIIGWHYKLLGKLQLQDENVRYRIAYAGQMAMAKMLQKGFMGEMEMRNAMWEGVLAGTSAMVAEELRIMAMGFIKKAVGCALAEPWKAAAYIAGAAALTAGAGAMEAHFAERQERLYGEGGGDIGGYGGGAGGTGGGGARTQYGTTVSAERMEMHISPSVSIVGDIIVIGDIGVEELKETLGRVSVESVQDALETGEIDIQKAVK